MWIEASTQVDRPVTDVFAGYADDHVRNHPRWDPDIELEATSGQPMGVGTIIHRRNVRYETPVEGTIEVVEFQRDKAFGVTIREGEFEMPGRVTFQSVGPATTVVTIGAELPGSVDEQLVADRMQRSAGNIKQLIEADL
ncbi:MAG TPA: SRPBCC family protein [Nitriliruptorales bacterium]